MLHPLIDGTWMKSRSSSTVDAFVIRDYATRVGIAQSCGTALSACATARSREGRELPAACACAVAAGFANPPIVWVDAPCGCASPDHHGRCVLHRRSRAAKPRPRDEEPAQAASPGVSIKKRPPTASLFAV